ncbi:AAA family ATPase [Bartonella sp. cb54]|uniref:AAA family ATPase n=1 Tax=Bartonella sp. cb54 TaxID=3385560 RepID=UPI0039A67D23
MLFTSFKLENFRGISQPVEIDFTKGNQDFPFVLVGNNESGKTTILKGIHSISALCHGEEAISALCRAEKVENFDVFIRSKCAFFNKKTILSTRIFYDADDIKILKKAYSNKKKKYNKTFNDNGGTFELSFVYEFVSSTCKDKCTLIDNKCINNIDFIMKWIAERTPEIVYYDDFMFDVPDIIRFSKKGCGNEDPLLISQKNSQWQMILNDLLVGSEYKRTEDSTLDFNIDFQKDVVDCDDTDAVDQRLAAMNGYLNSVVKKDWVDITGDERAPTKSAFTNCTFVIERPNSNFNSNFADFCLKIKAESNSFSVHERSKGFRWFFCFKIFTEIRTHRSKNGTVFLLDEPANNLHIYPQEKILSCLQNLPQVEHNKVIYSTHSPYLIDENSLVNLFSVYNEANDFEESKIICENFFELSHTPKAARSIDPIIQKLCISEIKKGGINLNDKLSQLADAAGKGNQIIEFIRNVGYILTITNLVS